MEEENIVNQSQAFEDSDRGDYIEWFKKQDPRILFGISALIVITIFIAAFVFYGKFSGTKLFNDKEQSTGVDFNFSEEDKMNTLESLKGDSGSVDVSNTEKHGQLDQLSESFEVGIRQREFEKFELLDSLK